MPASLFLHDFTVLDFAFVHAEQGVLGDSYYVSAELCGELDEKQFLLDFSVAKKLLKELVDTTFDHKLLVPMGSGVAEVKSNGLLLQTKGAGLWDYTCARSAFELFPDATISKEVIQYHLARLALEKLPKNVTGAKFSLSSPARFESEANFRYTHGLQYHEGNCQRLFHGHRNPIEVYIAGKRSPAWEARLAAEWEGAHFVAAATLKNRAELDLPLGARVADHKGIGEISYESSQGKFVGLLPVSRLVITETEPSIETMSALACRRIRSWGENAEIRVVAYEGLNKGAAFTL